MDKLSLLVLSDIHFGKLAVSPDLAVAGATVSHTVSNAAPFKQSLIETAIQHAPDAILVSGDITSEASPAEFGGVRTLVEGIAHEVGVASENVFYTFGNHDSNWRVSKLSEGDDTHQNDDGYSSVASLFGSFFINNPECEIPGPLPGCGFYERGTFEIIVLNTGWNCTHDQAFAHGKLGELQLKWASEILARPENPAKWRILMLHHHIFNYPYILPGIDISSLEEGPELLEMLGKSNVHVVCHGHRHHPRIQTNLGNGWKIPVTFFCAGSVGVTEHHRSNGLIPNFFHILSLDEKSQKGAATGIIHNYEYNLVNGWIPTVLNTPKIAVDGMSYFGSCATAEEQRSAGFEWLAILKQQSNGAAISLPALNLSPLEIRCMQSAERFHMLREIADDLDLRIYGRYPDESILMPK